MARAIESQSVATPAPRATRLTRTWRRRLWATLALIVIVAGAIVVTLPLAWMVSTSLKKSTEVFVLPPQWIPPNPQWGNYKTVFESAPFARYFLNSAIVTGSSVFGTLLSCSLAAYAFARLRFPGRNLIFVMLLSTLMLPATVTIVPRFIVFEQLDWLNSFKPLIVPSLFGNALNILLLREVYRTIPNDLEDADTLDGASPLRIFATIV